MIENWHARRRLSGDVVKRLDKRALASKINTKMRNMKIMNISTHSKLDHGYKLDYEKASTSIHSDKKSCFKERICERDPYCTAISPKNIRNIRTNKHNQSAWKMNKRLHNKSLFSIATSKDFMNKGNESKLSPKFSQKESMNLFSGESTAADFMSSQSPLSGLDNFYKKFKVNRKSKMSNSQPVSPSPAPVARSSFSFQSAFRKHRHVSPMMPSKELVNGIVDKILEGEDPEFEQGCYDIDNKINLNEYVNINKKESKMAIKESKFPLELLYNDCINRPVGPFGTAQVHNKLNRFDPTGDRCKIKPVVFTECKNFNNSKKKKNLISYEVMETGQTIEKIISKDTQVPSSPRKRKRWFTKWNDSEDKSNHISLPLKMRNSKVSSTNMKVMDQSQDGLSQILRALDKIENGDMEVNTDNLNFNIDLTDLKSRKYFEFPDKISLNRYVNLLQAIKNKKDEITNEDILKFSNCVIIKPNLEYMSEELGKGNQLKFRKRFRRFHNKSMDVGRKFEVDSKKFCSLVNHLKEASNQLSSEEESRLKDKFSRKVDHLRSKILDFARSPRVNRSVQDFE